ncbi:TetR/AcrR family transcriptional regulator [Prauserella alba]|nr:TetR/AcrR family transcriptional regulator [Prauserella alba]
MSPANPASNLRETKKHRTRGRIIDAVLRLGTDDGLEATTIAAIAAEADIGPRTFFRFFPTKEAAVVAPEEELFRNLLDALGDVGPTELLGTAFSRAFDIALGRLDTSWRHRFRGAAQLLESSPSANAAAMVLCARTREQLHAILRDSLQEAPQHVIELALEGVLSAWRLARRDWIAEGSTDPARLHALIRRNMQTLEERPLAELTFSGGATGS